jgi:hypothetical protein
VVTRALAAAAATALATACTPELADTTSLVAGPRLLAISSAPAEAQPSASVTLSALYVDAKGTRSAGFFWSFCIDRQTLTDPGTVSPDCVTPGGTGLAPLGSGPSATGPLPADTCRLFGPDPPDTTMGQPAGRPVDPDPTGGYYQPAILLVRDGGDSFSVGATRISCGLANATAVVAAQYTMQYRANTAPAIASLDLVHADGTMTPVPAGAVAGATATRSETLTLHATWAACSTAPVCDDGGPADCKPPPACTGSEQYVSLDLSTGMLAVHREAIRVAFYVTAGALGSDSAGRDETEADTSSTDDAWTAPADPGDVLLWLVVRDDRGGVGWESYRLTVE